MNGSQLASRVATSWLYSYSDGRLVNLERTIRKLQKVSVPRTAPMGERKPGCGLTSRRKLWDRGLSRPWMSQHSGPNGT
jgi:hypothetical protein